MVTRKKVIAVDEKFFNNVFEKKRKKLQEQLGLTNLSQANFSKMIKGFKVIEPKVNLKKKRGGKNNNEFFPI